MNLQELIRRFRVLANDQAQPCFWADEDVTDWLNDAQAQAAARGRLLREDADADVCRIALVHGQRSYALHPAVTEIVDLRLVPASGERARRMHLVSREWLEAEVPDWREDKAPAFFAVQDDTRLSVAGGFEAGDALALECYRLPLAPMAAPLDEPEIHWAHHERLLLWVLHKAFSVPDTETFDAQRSARAEEGFTAYFGPMPDSDLRRVTREDVPHHNAAILP
jgi:hypothetical protein